MISVCYIIVCVNLLYSFGQGETFSSTKTNITLTNEQQILLNSLAAENEDAFLAKALSPYWNMTYKEELDEKQKLCRRMVTKIPNRCMRRCQLLKIVPSPVTKAYRSRDDFNVGPGVDGNPKTVGILFGKRSLGRVFCFHPTKVDTVKESHKRVAQVYEDFIRLSPLPASYEVTDGGHWRSIFTRSNEAGDVMAVVVVQPKGYTNETVQDHQQALKEYFFQRLPNITLYHQQCPLKSCTHKIFYPYSLLYGKPYIIETLNGVKFKITPSLSFPKNKLGAEIFYDTLIRTAQLKRNTTVVDICSGSGTIIMSKFVREAVGIDFSLQTVANAKKNARFNNIYNVKFFLGRVEFELISVLQRLNPLKDVVLIINAQRIHIGLDIIRTIRRYSQISRILYIARKPNNQKSILSFIRLTSNLISPFPPFIMKKAIPFDTFPHTEVLQFIFLFERLNQKNYLK